MAKTFQKGDFYTWDDLWFGLKKSREEEQVLLLPNPPGGDHRQEGAPPNHSDFSRGTAGIFWDTSGTNPAVVVSSTAGCPPQGSGVTNPAVAVPSTAGCPPQLRPEVSDSSNVCGEPGLQLAKLLDRQTIQGLWPLAIISAKLLKRDLEGEEGGKIYFLHSPCHKGSLFVSVTSQPPSPGCPGWCVELCWPGELGGAQRTQPEINLGSALPAQLGLLLTPPLPQNRALSRSSHPAPPPGTAGLRHPPGCPSLQEDLPCQDDPRDKRDKEKRIWGFRTHLMLW